MEVAMRAGGVDISIKRNIVEYGGANIKLQVGEDPPIEMAIATAESFHAALGFIIDEAKKSDKAINNTNENN